MRVAPLSMCDFAGAHLPLDFITHSILRQTENMAASSDLIASASDYVFVYRGHCVAPCVPWPFEMSHSFRNAALLVTGHWTSRERCCRQLKTSGLSSSVILHFQLSQNLTFPHLRVNASQTSVVACQLRGSCRRFLQQIS